MNGKGTALITGASGGIGLELARQMAASGYALVLVARSADRLEALAADLRTQHGGAVRVLPADLAASGGVDALVAKLDGEGVAIDVLVNNAGYGLFGKHAELGADAQQDMITLNISALTRLTRLLLPGMLARRRGRILHIASTAAFQPGPWMAVYYATKAYVLSFGEALAVELRGTGVTVTTVCPGPTESGFQNRAEMGHSALVRGKRMPSSAEVAGFALRACEQGRMTAVHGWLNAIMAFSIRFTPRWLAPRIVAWISRPLSS